MKLKLIYLQSPDGASTCSCYTHRLVHPFCLLLLCSARRYVTISHRLCLYVCLSVCLSTKKTQKKCYYFSPLVRIWRFLITKRKVEHWSSIFDFTSNSPKFPLNWDLRNCNAILQGALLRTPNAYQMLTD